MASSSAARSAEIAELQQKMALIRRQMHEDVQGAVRGAQLLTDWRSLVGNHPWAALGVAAGLGYLLVPHRKPEQQALYSPPIAGLLSAAPPARTGSSHFPSVGSMVGLFAPILVRAAQNYASHYLEQWLEAHSPPVRISAPPRRPEPVEVNPGDREPRTVRFPNKS
jgi:hypothetical protein